MARRPLPLLALLVALVLVPACAKPEPTRTANDRVSVYVVKKVMPVGMLVATASRNGTLVQEVVPGDVAREDALTDLSGMDCLVANQNLATGTVARRSQFVEPEDVGLTGGLTGGTGERPLGC